MQKKVILMLVLIFYSVPVLSADFSGHQYSGDRFTVGDDEFLIRLSNDESILSFKSDLESIAVRKGDCESTQYYKYCFNDTIIDFSKDLGKLHDYTGEVMPAIKIIMTGLQAELKVTRTITSTTPKQYEPVMMTVNIKNEGKKAAKIDYVENITEGAVLDRCKSCTIIGDQVKYIATIYPSDDKEFSYWVDPKDIAEVLLIPSLKYETDVSNGTISISTTKIVPKRSLTVSYGGSKNLVVEDSYDSMFTFKNEDPSSRISYTSRIESDDALIFSSTESGVTQEGHTLIFKGTLDPGESKEYDVDLMGRKTGKRTYYLTNEYKLGSDDLSSNQSFDFEIAIEKPSFELILDNEMFSDVMESVELDIDNYGSKNSFKNMEISLSLPDPNASKAGLIDENFIIPFLKFGRDLKAYKKDFIILADSASKIEAKLDVSYMSIYDEVLSYSLTRSIDVKPISEIASVEHNVEDYKQDEGSLLVSTFIKNNHDDTLIFDINEKIEDMDILTLDDRELGDYTKLTESVDFYITSKSKKQAFSYKLKKGDSSIGNIYTILKFEGVTKDYTITVHSIVDFDKKTIVVNDTSIETGIAKTKEVVFNDTGVLAENIKIEQTHTYVPIEEKNPGGQDSSNTVEVSADAEKDTNNQELPSDNDQKKSFWDKIKEIFSVFF